MIELLCFVLGVGNGFLIHRFALAAREEKARKLMVVAEEYLLQRDEQRQLIHSLSTRVARKKERCDRLAVALKRLKPRPTLEDLVNLGMPNEDARFVMGVLVERPRS